MSEFDFIDLMSFNFVPANCPADFTKKGCFNDLQNPRPLPRLLFTDLDQKAPEYSGFPVDWGNFDNYLENVACRCAQVSKAKGFTYFGIENFGEYREHSYW